MQIGNALGGAIVSLTMSASCPVKGLCLPSKGGRMVSVTNTLLPCGGRSFLLALMTYNGAAHQVSALIDTGAEGDFYGH